MVYIPVYDDGTGGPVIANCCEMLPDEYTTTCTIQYTVPYTFATDASHIIICQALETSYINQFLAAYINSYI